jgi:WD40 repeat protein
MTESVNNPEKEGSNIGLAYELRERLTIKENLPCDKCSINSKNVIIYSCSHKLCFNCIFKYFISSNFKGMTTFSIKTVCPKCKEGEIEIGLDDYIEILKLLLCNKNPNFGKEEDEQNNNNNMNNSNLDRNCHVHEDKKVIKYCKQCDVDLCEKCLGELHDRHAPNHVLIDINKKDNKKNINNKNSSSDNISNNKEINNIQEKETIFMQRLESESIMLQTRISQLSKDINNLLENYNNRMNIFRNNMKKIFQIINLTYYNYYTSNDTDKKEISKKDLIDFNALLKKVDLNEINVSLQKINKDFSIEQPIFNFELQWDGEDYKKKYELKPKKDDDDKPDCVTKIIELSNVNKLVSSLINGQIYVWDLSAKKIDFSINAHKSAIWSMIKLSNDNIVSGSSDKMIKIWDILSGMSEPTIKLRGHKATVFCLGEIEKNKLLSGSEDRTIKLWDLEQKKCIMSLDDPNGSKINCLHILPDPGFIITGGDDNLLKIWNIYSDYVPNTLVGHECTIWSIASISDDDTQIASGSSDNTIKIWDLISLKCRFTLEGHENTISSLKLLNNGYLISSSWDKLINIWNLNTRNCIVSIKGHNNIVWDVIQLSDGDLASCSSDTKIIVWTKNNLNNN